MARIVITINSREYAVACDDGQERYMLQLARILDEKARQLTAGGGQINENMLLAMVGLLVADELMEARKELSALKDDANQRTNPQDKHVTDHVSETADLHMLDGEIAVALNEVTAQIKMLANEIKSM